MFEAAADNCEELDVKDIKLHQCYTFKCVYSWRGVLLHM